MVMETTKGDREYKILTVVIQVLICCFAFGGPIGFLIGAILYKP
jgi:hypothetical protein